MFQSTTLCDVVLQWSECPTGAGIACHRVVLAAASSYFAAMFTAGMIESHMQHIVIHQVEANALQQLVTFCYTGETD